MRVMKFGGAALRDGEAVRQAARIVLRHGGGRPLVVTSAHEGVTALLEHAFEEALHGRLEWDPIRVRSSSGWRSWGCRTTAPGSIP